MRRPLALAAAALSLWGCSSSDSGTHTSVASSVSVSPNAVTFEALGATRVVHASVRDQDGQAMGGASLSWSSSSAAATVAGAGGDSAIVTAVANGSATITATSGSAAGTASVSVAQAVAAVQKTQGDAQSGSAGAALATQLRVKVVDSRGAGVAGQTVTFAVTSGGGSVNPATATTGADGTAATTWTLGPGNAGGQVVTATVGAAGGVTFTANVNAGTAASATAAVGAGQTWQVGAAVPTPPGVKVTDASGNAVVGLTVNFSVTAGGGSITGAQAVTDVAGVASVGSWTMGAVPGVNTLTATIPGTALPPVVFNATALTAVAGSVAAVHGSGQAAMAGTAVQTAPAVVVKDVLGNVMPGVPVSFAVTAGGGTVASATATTNASGVASVGWTVGGLAGPNRMSASISGKPAVNFSAVGCSGGGGSGYAITLCFTTSMTTSQRAVFESAAARWGAIVTGDLVNVPGDVAGGTCGSGSPEVNFNIDDLVIFAAIEDIDGAGQILGSAGWCYRRDAGLPLAGLMRFDAADVAMLEAGGQFGSVILHEMGHVLGIGSLWNAFGLLQDPSSGIAQDTWFSGTNGLAGFNAIGGATYTGGQKVPVENTGGGGTVNSHWRESVLANELMTGFLNGGGPNPLSQLTVRSLADLGYSVDVTQADPFFLTLSVRGSKSGTSGPKLQLVNDVYTGPQYLMDRRGRATRIR
ncbi:leishmanolysin-related zinc metalloendopeptidase [Longimicrobium sp.]|uniref:leishmanolysin-related zinc metalloendopeptidase n=1 Tax=Longimicrobium sp. TaxID=2029185 RepID=UPI002CA661E9|nr:leishmanolysin-related zinc metalloendopeptidase [Longimicrobium sp.]HSU13637.1 leishmanolysin-related zinc metalloendopeptidase [Longimicrobium sp.]